MQDDDVRSTLFFADTGSFSTSNLAVDCTYHRFKSCQGYTIFPSTFPQKMYCIRGKERANKQFCITKLKFICIKGLIFNWKESKTLLHVNLLGIFNREMHIKMLHKAAVTCTAFSLKFGFRISKLNIVLINPLKSSVITLNL